jgi:hypothetical protein
MRGESSSRPIQRYLRPNGRGMEREHWRVAIRINQDEIEIIDLDYEDYH